MEYPLLELSVLIDLLLVKENLPKNRKSLIALLEKVEDNLKDESDRSDVQYLYKLNDKLAKDFRLGNASISAKESFVNCCLDYLEYESFEEFQKEVEGIKQAVETKVKDKSRFRFLLHPSVKEEVEERIKTALYRKQEFNYELIEITSLQELQKDKEASAMSGLVVISSALYLQKEKSVKNWLDQNKEASFISLWWSEDGSIPQVFQEYVNKGELLKEPYDFKVLMQLLQNPFWGPRPVTQEKEEQGSITISDSNTVVLGNMSIKGKYVAERDMYFQKIKKSKKDGA